MNRIIVLTLGLLVNSLITLYAQVNFQPGYVVTLQGDTLKGYIDYRNWERNPKVISFSVTGDGATREFAPLGIRSFYAAGEFYEGAIVSVEVSPNRTDQLNSRPDANLITDTTFLRALVRGEKSLYYYRYSSPLVGKDQLYIQTANGLELLIYKSYFRIYEGANNYDGTKVIAQNNLYINQLASYLKDCPDIQKKLKNIRYNISSVKRIFNSYYACTNKTAKFEESEVKHPLEIGVLIGGMQTSLKFSTTSLSPSFREPYPSDRNFTAGLFFDLIRARNHRKWSINNELAYTSYQTGAFHVVTPDTGNGFYEYQDVHMEFAYVKLNTMLRFKYPVGGMYVFVNAGMANGFMVKGKDSQKNIQGFPSGERVTESNLFKNGVRRYEQGFFGGVGVRYNRFALECRYEKANGMLDYVGLQAGITRTSLILAYRFTNR